MEMDPTLIFVFVIVLLVSLWYLTRRRNLPPGPWSGHIFGHIMEAERSPDFYLTLMEYRRRYGDVFRLRFGFCPVVVLNSPATIREALVQKADNFSQRPSYLRVVNKVGESKGITFNIHNWQFTRKMAMSSMRGVGKSTLEGKCQEEMEILMEEFTKQNGKPFNCEVLMTNAVSNIICGVIYGKRFDYNDEKFQLLMGLMRGIASEGFAYLLPNFVPFLLEIALIFDQGKSARYQERMQNIRKFIRENVEEHRESFDPDNIRDFTDLILLSQQDGSEAKISEEDAAEIITEVFVAGTETTSTTMQWLFVYMMYNQEVQDKCREEIHQVIGPVRCPSMSDRGKLVYTEATLLEVQRIVTIAPLSLPHAATCDVTVGGYTIPKDAFVIPNLYSCHRDHESWGDPDNFRPERWIGDDGKIIKHPAFLPFSVGKRVCPGEDLARMETFIFGVSFLQRFKFKMAATRPNLLPNQGVTNVPRPFDMIAELCT